MIVRFSITKRGGLFFPISSPWVDSNHIIHLTFDKNSFRSTSKKRDTAKNVIIRVISSKINFFSQDFLELKLLLHIIFIVTLKSM